MRIEERGLPPFFTYINARLNGRPLVAAIWAIAMLATCVLVYVLDPRRGIIGDAIIAVALLFIVIIVAVLTSVVTRSEGRSWLLAKYNNGTDKVSAGSRLVVRLLPLVGVVVAVEYFWLH